MIEANSLQHDSNETDISPYILPQYLSSLENSNILKYISWTYTDQDGCTLVLTWIYTSEAPQLSVFSIWVRTEKTWMSGPFPLLTVQENRRMWMEPMTLTLRLQHPYLSHFLPFFFFSLQQISKIRGINSPQNWKFYLMLILNNHWENTLSKKKSFQKQLDIKYWIP